MNEKLKSLEPKLHSFFEEFKKFAFKGNVIDLAVGVVIGTTFGKVVSSLVDHVMMPAISLILPGESGFTAWSFGIAGRQIHYGLFLAELLNFVLVSLAVFVFIVKFFGWLARVRGEEEPAQAPALTRDQELLIEIRDLLKQRANQGIKE
jgi:large conductance mechanosensitive channel